MAKDNTNSEWDLGWDENWDNRLPDTSPQNKNSLEVVIGSTQKEPKKLEEILAGYERERDTTADQGFDLKWGEYDDETLQPTNLKARLTKLINPFSKALNLPEQKTTTQDLVKEAEAFTSHYTKSVLDLPKIDSAIAKEKPQPAQHLGVSYSDLEFNNLNSISPTELDGIDNLLEGSLGNAPEVKLDEIILSDQNAHLVQFEKDSIKKAEEEKRQQIEEQKNEAEETVISDQKSPEATFVPELSNLRFDLKATLENTSLFEPHEIDQVLQRIPLERERIGVEFSLPDQNAKNGMSQEEVGNSLFEAVPGAPTLADEGAGLADGLLDSLLDEIDDELGESSFGDSQFDRLNTESLGKDEILSEEAILNDDESAALEFIDSASMEVESMFEDFFKQGTDADSAKSSTKKPSLVQKIKTHIDNLKSTCRLFIRFLQNPKYFFEYYQITIKDVYVGVGFFFCLVIYTGFINYQHITQRFPMNLF